MPVVATFPGKMGDAILQWPVMFHWARQTGQQFECWLDEHTCKLLVPLFEAQPCVSKVRLVSGVENWNCGGQPFHMNLPTSEFAGNTVYHMGFRSFPSRQITLETLTNSRVPVTVAPEELAETPTFSVGQTTKYNRLVLHGQSVYAHTRNTPTFWKFLASVRGELDRMFTEVVFVGNERDRAVGLATYPDWTAFDDGGDMLKLGRFIAESRAMVACGSGPVTLAGALKVPAIRVHDVVGGQGDGTPKVVFSNLGENQLNEAEVGLRSAWPAWRDRWLKPVDATAGTP